MQQYDKSFTTIKFNKLRTYLLHAYMIWISSIYDDNKFRCNKKFCVIIFCE